MVYSPPKLLRLNIDGEAGTGKSHFIIVLFRILSKLAAIASKPLLLVRATPTSITTFSVNGQTIYNPLKLPV